VVGVTERFDETLLLLKRKLGWSENLHYYPKNRNVDRLPVSSLSQETVQAIMERNEFDIELHSFAEELLQESIDRQDPTFHRDLENFRALQRARGVHAFNSAKAAHAVTPP
jgi:hypothetical protein